MKKTLCAAVLAVCLLPLTLSGCNGKTLEEYRVKLNGEPIPAAEQEQEVGSAATESGNGSASLFSNFRSLQFTFSSGAGGWATLMTIDSDGSFSGEFYDGELGSSGPDYPNGTTYQSNFSGTFTQPEKVNDYTYSLQIQEINYEKEPGTEEIIDGMLYSYAKPYGLDGAEELLIYLPGAPLDQLPEEFLSWVRTGWTGDYDLADPECTELPFYGLYNAAEECGFSSYDRIGYLDQYLVSVESQSAALEDSLQNDPLTQLEMNETSSRLYNVWDMALNQVWDIVKQTTEASSWENVLNEQREWISQKEQAVSEAGAEYAGGSMQGMVMNMKAAELTKERVYELAEFLKSE